MQTTMMTSSAPVRPLALSTPRLPQRAALQMVHAKKETSSGTDSYSKIEAPVRGEIPDGGAPVAERDAESRGILTTDEGAPDKAITGSDIGAADAMRFMGAIPEVANCRLSMLGVLAALGAELATGKNVFEQIAIAPVPIALTFLLFTVATAVPVFKGAPRRGNSIFTSDAEIINGRLAMVGFAGLLFTTANFGHSLPFLFK